MLLLSLSRPLPLVSVVVVDLDRRQADGRHRVVRRVSSETRGLPDSRQRQLTTISKMVPAQRVQRSLSPRERLQNRDS